MLIKTDKILQFSLEKNLEKSYKDISNGVL